MTNEEMAEFEERIWHKFKRKMREATLEVLGVNPGEVGTEIGGNVKYDALSNNTHIDFTITVIHQPKKEKK